ncbi:MAG TPA: TonB-dependent receptor, partial [Bacteroidota bacterium]|nr:TonB-dependent receptor [Bacteroidota bacterium]
DIALQLDVVQFDEVTVTAQLEGQVQAINQQLTSNTIGNVVSSDRIRELPDQNAAESIARLPGISLQRDAGEGQKVVVRGLSPRFNAITVNGERIPSTDAQDRSVDLSMISSDLLSGIEVFKALTPDKDGDAVGGTVNLVLKRAPPGFRGDFRGQSGYNQQRKEFGTYRSSLSLSDRFLDDDLGVLVTASLQRANRSSDVLTADYIFKREASGTEEKSIIDIDNLNLAYRSETRQRYGAGVALDYVMSGGELFFSSFLTNTDRDEVRHRKRYRVGAFTVEYDLRDREISTRLLTSSLRGRHKLGDLETEWQMAYSNSHQETPFSHYSRLQEVGGFNSGMVYDRGPEIIPSFAKNDLSSTWFQYATLNPEDVRDKDLSAQVNLKFPFRLEEFVAGSLKGGGKFRGKTRTRDVTEYRTPFGEIDKIGQASGGKYTLYRNTNILIENFLDRDFTAEDFLQGRYQINAGLHTDLLNEFQQTYTSRYMLNRFLDLDDYDVGEDITAGYLMAEVNVGDQLTILPGFRYEHTKTTYDGNFGYLQGNLGEFGTIQDTTGGQLYDEFLPMIHVRYRFTPWFDVRLAYTKSLARPDYFNLVPFERINFAEQTLQRGNPGLRHTKATNFDVYLSLYSNDVGLLTLGWYYKQLKDIDYIKQSRIVGGQFNAFELTEPVNGDESKVWGIEVDLQTNLRNLPSPFDGFVINANYSYIKSETFFPFFEIGPRSPDPPYRPIIIDTFRKGTLPGQAEHIGNLSLGYEKGGFSGRVSVTYQGKSLLTVGSRSELDGYTESSLRLDAALSQRISSMFSIYAELNNLTNQAEQAYLGEIIYPTNEEFFGWTADLGVRITF